MLTNGNNPTNVNIQQLGQTKITCEIPASLTLSSASGSITISDADLIPNLESQFEIFFHLSLQVEKSAAAGTAITSATLGEQISLKLLEDSTLSGLTNKFKYDFFIISNI